jgi:polyisoprenyl-teichoic acid--peptidoglycan teichoic acid transferase
VKRTRAFIASLVGAASLSIAAGAVLFHRDSPSHDIPASPNPVLKAAQAPVRAIQQMLIPDPTRVFGKDHLRVLLVGLDYDYDRLDQPTSKSSRSDILMALNLDFKNHRVSELSVPRDMVATLPNGQRAKIDQAQSDGGITEAKAVIANWLGIPSFDRYIVMRINTSKDVVNAIGGIEVDVKNSDALKGRGPNGPLNYDDSWGHLHVHLKPGMQHLDGDQAVGYARFRHDWCSDPCRIMRQQQVVRAIVDKIEQNKLNTLAHAEQLLAVVHKDIATDITMREQIASVMAFAHLQPRDIRTAQVPYVGSVVLPDYGDSIIPDEAGKQKLVASLLLTPQEVARASAPPVEAPAIRVRVENGTSVPGLAARVAANLQREGFQIAEIRDADSHDLQVTQIEAGPQGARASESVRKALGRSVGTTRFTPSATADGAADVTVVLGRDIVDSAP